MNAPRPEVLTDEELEEMFAQESGEPKPKHSFFGDVVTLLFVSGIFLWILRSC